MSIVVDGICKSYGGVPVLDQVSLTIVQPGVTCLFGISGSGKTTLLRLLLGLERPDRGELVGVPKATAAVFQEDRLMDWLTARQNVEYVLPHAKQKEAEHLLTQVGLHADMDKPARALSGGMRRRVALARAMAVQPELLLLDEPFTGLDQSMKGRMIQLVKEYAETHAVLLVSHDPSDAQALGGNAVWVHL